LGEPLARTTHPQYHGFLKLVLDRAARIVRARAVAFTRERAGVLAIVIALAAVPLMLATGAAIDFGRAYVVKARLGYALDAAGLAVGSSDPAGDLDQVFRRYFEANFPSHELGAPFSVTMTVDGPDISIAASARVDTTFLKLIHKDTIEVKAEAKIIRDTKGLEVVLVMDNTGSMASYGRMTALKAAATDLVNILFGPQAVADKLWIGLVPFSGAVNINAAGWPNRDDFINSYAGLDYGPSSWMGCVLERPYPHDVQDSNVPTGGKWSVLYWDDHGDYNNWVSGKKSKTYDIDEPEQRGPNKYCPQAITPLTNVKATLLPRIQAMIPVGNTHVNVGAAWGWRVISRDPPFTEGSPYNTPGINKAVVIMTDGENTHSSAVYTAYRYLSDGVLGTTNANNASNVLDKRLLEVCAAMKQLGIIVYTITLGLNDSGTQDLYRTCATEPAKYFNSPSAAELQGAFRAIGAELSNLRIAK
jgi:Flp pilus assembly protein TadG